MVISLSKILFRSIDFLKIFWAWSKKNWKFITGFLVATFIFLLTRKKFDWEEYQKKTKEDYKKEIEIINNSHEKEISDRDKAIKEYMLSIKNIEIDHEKDIEDLDEQTKKRILKLLKDSKEDPESLTKKISDITGFKIHK